MPRQSVEVRTSTASFNARVKTVAFRPHADRRTTPSADSPALPFAFPSPIPPLGGLFKPSAPPYPAMFGASEEAVIKRFLAAAE